MKKLIFAFATFSLIGAYSHAQCAGGRCQLPQTMNYYTPQYHYVVPQYYYASPQQAYYGYRPVYNFTPQPMPYYYPAVPQTNCQGGVCRPR